MWHLISYLWRLCCNKNAMARWTCSKKVFCVCMERLIILLNISKLNSCLANVALIQNLSTDRFLYECNICLLWVKKLYSSPDISTNLWWQFAKEQPLLKSLCQLPMGSNKEKLVRQYPQRQSEIDPYKYRYPG